MSYNVSSNIEYITYYYKKRHRVLSEEVDVYREKLNEKRKKNVE